ncbi:uncharacterized protein LOC131672200 [Phymastichus coffea]|uniref:uncharacterized protein LOC131672200 n=1 Tax=Phymastichus coffea TaxID=108790 RepID=UPI00273BF113|nr:uncharacterized protein LOC131672200 [Phymastichus coffea]
MENYSRSRRGSSAGSSSLEVRCACQYYKSDSLLPERSALAAQHRHLLHHNVNMVQTPPAGRKSMPVRCGEHEYEPIGQPAIRVSVRERTMSMRLVAPVVKITDTDVIPVGDSDDSIDDRYRFRSRALILDGDVILPLDGRIEDNVMDGKNLGDQTMDDEVESPQDFQDRLEERFQTAVIPPLTGSRTDVKIQPIQVNSSDSPQRKDTVGQRLKSQAGRLRTRFKSIQKPTFMRQRAARSKSAEKSPTVTAAPVEKPPASPRSHQKASRMERFRMALPERPKFSLPDKSKFHLPDKSKFHIDTAKFHIKKPNIKMPKSLSKPKRSASQRETKPHDDTHPSETASTKSGRRNIFDFSTLPRPKIFDRKAKAKDEYVTSSPKESRAQSTESSTFPRAKKASQSLSARWAARFGETIKGFHHEESAVPPLERSKPWRHPSLEKPRLSLKPQESSEGEELKLPWESSERRYDAEDEAEEDRDMSYGDRSDIKEFEPPNHKEEPIRDPRLEDEQLMQQFGTEERKKRVTLVEDTGESAVDLEVENEHQTYHPKELGSFPPVDPREFQESPIRAPSGGLSEDEESMRSDREIQQSSGSSCERRRHGVIEEIDSDEFFLREKGISQENMRFHIMNEIRDALRPRADDTPPIPPKRTRSMRKRQEESLESFDVSLPPEKPKRELSLRRSQMSLDHTNSVSSSRHRIVYQTDGPFQRDKGDLYADEPLDNIVVVKPERRKSRTSLRSQSIILPTEESNILSVPMQSDHVGINAQDIEDMMERQRCVQTLDISRPSPPVVPTRRKRLRRDQSSSLSIRTNESALCNGYGDLAGSHERIPPPTPPPTPPLDAGISEREIEEMIQRQLRVQHIDELDYILPQPPVPPKRIRSRTASLAPEDDRTSHGAESLPGDFGYVDEDILTIPRDSSSREPSLPGYAVIEKKEKPPRPPLPKRKRGKFATAPRPSKNGPKRPTRTYSTLRPAKSDTLRKSTESMPFMDADFDEAEFHKDLRSGDVLIKIQGRPLPAPPRPPRRRRDFPREPTPIIRCSLPREITPDFSETVASTQTDPLPDDLVIEEEITTAKLVVTPSRSGSSQILISTESERVPSPTGGSFKSVTSGTPPIPPLPGSMTPRDGDRTRAAEKGISDRKEPPSDDSKRVIDLSQLEMLRTALFSTDEPLRIPHLEVGDLKVDRLTVSQLEAYKVAASEIDAIVVSATEMTGKTETESLHPSLLQELIAIRNQLQAVVASQPQSRPQSAMEDASTATSNERIDLPFDIDRRSTTERRIITRESSPLLVVASPPAELEATGDKGRTLLPHSSSTSDLPSTGSDSITVSENVVTVIPVEPVEALDEVTIISTELSTEESTTAITNSTESLVALTTSTKMATARSRSRSASPTRVPSGAVRQTASPVKSLPPVISVTPDAITSLPMNNNTVTTSESLRHAQESNGAQPQRAVISYRGSDEDDLPNYHHRQNPPSRDTSSPSPPPSLPPTTKQSQQLPTNTQFIAFSTSQIPSEFFSLASSPPSPPRAIGSDQIEPSITEMTGQLFRALSQAGSRSLRNFVDSVVSRFADSTAHPHDAATSAESQQVHIPDEKLRRVELAVCALLILIAGLIVFIICMPRTVTHHHHWDYFNPPQ